MYDHHTRFVACPSVVEGLVCDEGDGGRGGDDDGGDAENGGSVVTESTLSSPSKNEDGDQLNEEEEKVLVNTTTTTTSSSSVTLGRFALQPSVSCTRWLPPVYHVPALTVSGITGPDAPKVYRISYVVAFSEPCSACFCKCISAL
jgi:hypothetical protein